MSGKGNKRVFLPSFANLGFFSIFCSILPSIVYVEGGGGVTFFQISAFLGGGYSLVCFGPLWPFFGIFRAANHLRSF